MASKPCAKSFCPRLVPTGQRHCEQHRKQVQQTQDKKRGTAHQRGYDSRWQKARVGFLNKHPLCVHCEANNIIESAVVVDHIVPHKGDKAAFWNRANWQPLCKRCHDIKTATEDGGFGR